MGWKQVSGAGVIYGYTVMHQPLVSGFEEAVPYNVIAVELDEQPGLLLTGNLIGDASVAPKVGSRVELVYEEIAEGFMLPQFHLVQPPEH
jgi:uncharacterized OB-fold protein